MSQVIPQHISLPAEPCRIDTGASGGYIADMSSFAFDTHAAIKALTQAGFEEAQAEAVGATVSDAVGGNVAMKTDIERLEKRIEARIEALELRMTIRLGAMVFAAAGRVIAALKLFP